MKSTPNWLIFWLWFLLALIFYSLPWLITPDTGLNLGAYDLADWASLHPAVRVSSPPILLSFVLRLPLLLLALIVALIGEQGGRRWLRVIIVGLIALALLPPLEFFTQYRDDPNYRQQFVLAVVTILGSAIASSLRVVRWRSYALSGLAFAGILLSLWGSWQGYNLLSDFRLPLRLGFGGIGLALCFLIMLILYGVFPLFQWKTNRVARA